ncbi:DNA polymerase III subunit alpha [Gracilibacillus oryzae]|uniref:DNA polymerase III subunit alpha n=1 Tax=Gracilibacillus oryzae TaxID=1672701 RepID=A0A7C8KRI6_9BACI|nr:DNA polymerase III subunit alpha [Gracilibacillus oryzae]KAB8138286.1 DNA polymerase III subunit alpha [Gracilibacillus oryzae]
MPFTQLHVKSGYSLQKSMIQIDELVQQSKELGYTHLALTDEGVLHGAVPFYNACKKAGIEPIIGMEITVYLDEEQPIKIILLARNLEGYQHLLAVSSAVQKGKIFSFSDFQEMTEDLFFIIKMDTLINENELDPEKIKVIIQTCENISVYFGIDPGYKMIWPTIRSVLDQYSATGVAISDIRYIHKQDRIPFHCLRSMALGEKWESQQPVYHPGSHLESEIEQQNVYNEWPELVEQANKIALSCRIDLPLHQHLLPRYHVPNGENADNYLEKLCQQLLQDKYEKVTNKIYERLNYELDVIHSMGFSDYFLIVADFIHYAKKEKIMVGPGRGSAAGSLVAYILGITNVDPIQYDLLFERFLNPERVTMPDIDIDFSDEKRDQVIEYVVEKYGREHVAQIITFGTFAARSILRELAKTMDIPDSDMQYILKILPKDHNAKLATLVNQSNELIEYVKQSDKLKQFFKIANRLEGLPRHISTHAAGVIISDQQLIQHVPVIPAQNDIYLTQYAMKELEQIGLLKMDFLGLRNLTLIERIITQLDKLKISIDIETIPLNDENTFELLRNGQTNGVFQLESQGMKQVLRDMQPSHFEDIVAVNALYRPGPMQFIPTYNNRKNGRETVEYIHKDLQPILEKTYGVLIYQEQIMQIANKLAGFSYGEADLLRRAVSKKEKEAILAQKEKFIQGCKQNGYTLNLANEVFDWIIRFSNYGFNRSHAVAYSMIAYQLAYLKANYPLVFFAEVLSMQMGNVEKLQMYIREAKNQGIVILPPSINKSIGKFKVEGQAIRMGLSVIKGIGYTVVHEILTHRKNEPFKNIFDFCLRIPGNLKRTVIESLVLAGAFDETHPNRATILASLDDAIEQGELFGEFDDQFSLFDDELSLDVSYVEKEPFPAIKQLMMEQEVIGFFVSKHPLQTIRQDVRERGYITIEDALTVNRRKTKLAAVIQTIRVIRTKKGESMAFVTIADETNELDTVIFPNIFREVNHWLEEELFVFVDGRLDERNGKKQLIVEKVEQLIMDKQKSSNRKFYINWTEDQDDNRMEELKLIAKNYAGNIPVYLYKKDKKKLFKLDSQYNLDDSFSVTKQLKELFGEENVVFRQES